MKIEMYKLKVNPKTGKITSKHCDKCGEHTIEMKGALRFFEASNKSYISIINPINKENIVESVALKFDSKEEMVAFVGDHLKQFEILSNQEKSTKGIHIKIMHTLEQFKNKFCIKCENECKTEDDASNCFSKKIVTISDQHGNTELFDFVQGKPYLGMHQDEPKSEIIVGYT
jgi:hypothetical protein